MKIAGENACLKVFFVLQKYVQAYFETIWIFSSLFLLPPSRGKVRMGVFGF